MYKSLFVEMRKNILIKILLECVGADENPCKCVFPFKYNGVTYNTCTMDGEEALWCATGTNADGEYVGDYGWCYGGFLQAFSLDV